MPKEKYIISVPKPCTENWEEMTPVEQGRFCTHCQKKVIDFTELNDNQMVQVLRTKQGQSFCGRYYPWQLNREITPSKPLQSPLTQFFKKIAASFLLAYTSVSSARAQNKIPASHQLVDSLSNEKKSQPKPKGIGGTIRDIAHSAPLKGMEVKVKGTDFKCISDAMGRFFIPLPDSFFYEDQVLVASYTPLAKAEPAGTVIPEVTTDFEYAGWLNVHIYRFSGKEWNLSSSGHPRYIAIAGQSGEDIVFPVDNKKSKKPAKNWLQRLFKNE